MLRKCASLICFVIIICVNQIFAQGPDTLWTKTFGGSGDEFARSVQQTSDGGYIIAGYTNSYGAGGDDAWLLKTDSSGDTLWTKTYGGVNDDECRSVQQTADGGYIVAGGTASFGAGGDDVWLLKTDSSGDTLWTKTYGGTLNESAYEVQQTFDGGYVVVGLTTSFGTALASIYLLKTDVLGDTIWTKTYALDQINSGYAVQQTFDGGYIITGTSGFSSLNICLIKTDAAGNTLWAYTYGGTAGYSVQQTSDSGYIAVGNIGSTVDLYLLKTDTLGNALWTKTYGGSGDDYGMSVQQTSEGGYIVAGYTNSFGTGGHDIWLLKTDNIGDTLWTELYGGSNDDKGRSVQQTADRGYIVAGHTTSFGAGGNDVWLIKTEVDPVGIIEEKEFAQEPIFSLQVEPNPFRGKTEISFTKAQEAEDIELKIYDISGRMVKSFNLISLASLREAGRAGILSPASAVVWDGKDNRDHKVPAGVYIVRLKTDIRNSTRKVILLR